MKPLLIFTVMLCTAVTAAYAEDATKATATLQSKSNSHVTGTVTFTKSGDDVEVTGDIEGLSPGQHGFHIHEKGDCSAPDAASAGGHFNPTNKPHGSPDAPDHHAGDMPMLQAD